MKILLVGSGGREHALAWLLAQSNRCAALYCAPGNAGISECAEIIDIGAEDIDALVSFAKEKAIDLVVIGPEAPLVMGLVDRLQLEGIKAFGPSAQAAQLEGSKTFMKDLCAKYGVLTAAYGSFTDLDKAKAFMKDHGTPLVVKADGLAAGKGVIIAQTIAEAEKAAEEMLAGSSFGKAGHSIVIEEFLEGEELSYFAIADGKGFVPFESAQDHKQVGEGDTGLNTGGMGAYSPAHMMNPELDQKINDRIMRPFIEGMAKDGIAFSGVLFAGLMLVDGEPYLLEFNVRFGDPECQALMMRFESDLLELLLAASEGKLNALSDNIYWREGASLCVVMAAKGYPGHYDKNTRIQGLTAADMMPDTKIFHAGTKFNDQGNCVSAGGRVLGITSTGETIKIAQSKAYEAIDQIKWPDGFYRRDIGWRAMQDNEENQLRISIPC